MSLDWRVVPIDRWPGEQTEERKFHRFGSLRTGSYRREIDWMGTTDLLERELLHLGAENIVLQMALRRKDIRNDGWIRANAKPEHPGVILTFESTALGRPFSYPCDTFRVWKANVRGIALALEALRKIDRYGVTKRGEQYTGWAQLPPAGGTSTTMTARIAAEILIDVEEILAGAAAGEAVDDLLFSHDAVVATYRNAAKNAHPDRHGGDTKRFQLLQEAKAVLDAHHGTRS